jgi:predicted PurR-regulated permease PerM
MSMLKRLKINRYTAWLLVVCCLMGVILFAAPDVVHADPTQQPQTSEQTQEPETSQEPDNSEAAAQTPGIVVSDQEDEGNLMESILSADRQWLSIFGKIVARLAIVLGILIVCVVGVTIYIMVTQTTRLSKQNKQMSQRPQRIVEPNRQPTGQRPPVERQVTQFGDTLRIRRTVPQGGGNVRNVQGAANMQRPAAPQRPSRPAQGMQQPGARRPVQGQPVRRTPQSQPIRQPQRPTNTAQRPVQGQPLRQPQRRQPSADDTRGSKES